MKNELQNILSGNAEVSHGATIKTIANYLRRKKAAIPKPQETKLLQQEETKALTQYLWEHDFWFENIDETKYIGEGAEQKVYEDADPAFVLKLNSRIFYTFWEDYLHSLLLHNHFFPHLAYQLLGFYKLNQSLFAVVKQPFVLASEPTQLKNVKDFLSANGFIQKRENDYFHAEWGIILEDLHDENVLTKNGVLQFIDTVFYIMPS